MISEMRTIPLKDLVGVLSEEPELGGDEFGHQVDIEVGLGLELGLELGLRQQTQREGLPTQEALQRW